MSIRKLARKHRADVKRLLKALSGARRDPERRRKIFVKLDRAIRFRTAALQSVLYPLLDEVAEDTAATRQLLRGLKAADRDVLEALARLRDADPESARYRADAKLLEKSVRCQLRLRRERLFERVGEDFDSTERKTLGDAIEALEKQLRENHGAPVRNTWRQPGQRPNRARRAAPARRWRGALATLRGAARGLVSGR